MKKIRKNFKNEKKLSKDSDKNKKIRQKIENREKSKSFKKKIPKTNSEPLPERHLY